MATNTTNYGFKKPDESDFYDVADQNKNWDLADEALKNLDTPTFEDYTGSTAVPSATDAIDQIKSKGKLGTLLSNIKAAFKGACLIGHIVNNCVTDNAGLPLSAAQGKVLKDLYTQLYSEVGTVSDNLSKAIISSDLFADSSSPTFVRWYNGTANTPYKAGLTYGQEGFALVFGKISGWHTVIAWLKGGRNMWAHYVSEGTDYGWSEYAQKSDFMCGESIIPMNAGSTNVTFPQAFGDIPVVVAVARGSSKNVLHSVKVENISKSGFMVTAVMLDNGSATSPSYDLTVEWIAMRKA